MKSFAWMIGGFCAAAVGFLVWNSARPQSLTSPSAPVEELAHRLEDAWADHRTVA